MTAPDQDWFRPMPPRPLAPVVVLDRRREYGALAEVRARRDRRGIARKTLVEIAVGLVVLLGLVFVALRWAP